MALLGELEQAVMDVLWRLGLPLSVREVHDALSGSRDLAYTTVMTVLDRLAKKGIVTRHLDGRAWRYTAGRSRADLIADEIIDLLNSGSADERADAWETLRARMSQPVD